MPLNRCEVGVVTRGGGKGQSVIARAAYNARENIRDERTGLMKEHADRDGLEWKGIFIDPKQNAPEWMHDRAKLWNAVERREDQSKRRDDAQLARDFKIALPHELNQQQRFWLVRDYARELARQGMVVDAVIHAPDPDGDQRNYHAHLLVTMREITPDGFGDKVRQWNSKAWMLKQKERWSELGAQHLRKAGLPENEVQQFRYGHLTYEKQAEKARERGDHEYAEHCDREATKHLGPEAAALEKLGIPTDIGNENREIEKRNAERAELRELKQEHSEITWSLEYEAQREMQWQDRIAAAAIDKEKAEQRFLEPQQRENGNISLRQGYGGQAGAGGREKDNREQQPATPAHENIFKRINQSSLTSENAKAFAAALDEHGIAFAVVTPEEAYRSDRQAQFSKAVRNIPSPVLTAGEIVAVTGPSFEYRREGEMIEPRRVHQLDQTHAESYLQLLKTDRSKLQGIDATRQRLDDRAMQRAADWEATRLERATTSNRHAPETPARKPATPFKNIGDVIARLAYGIFGAVANFLFPIPAPLTPKQQEAKAERETIDLTDWLEQAEHRRHDEAQHRQDREQEYQRQRERERER